MKKPIHQLRNDIVFSARLLGHDFTFRSTWGLFSPDAIDPGTDLLLRHLEVKDGESVLDLGCGYGAIGVAIGKTIPNGFVHLVDKDFVAIEYANKNLVLNGVSNATAYLSNGFSRVPPGQRFDLIVSNLPAKVGRELYDVFFHDARQFLKPKGRIVVVTIAALKEAIKKSFRELFGNYQKPKQGSTHVVSLARYEPSNENQSGSQPTL
jgi:16S rRNA G1207 methylase RsmC